ncbi:MAG: hypothetical protein WCC12_07295 [Anaerolineales bacterium]
MIKRNATLSENQLYALEAHLAGTLKPVTPPREVVQRLRQRINSAQTRRIVSSLRDWQTMFVVFGGVMSSLLALITIGRALYYFVGKKQV